MKAKISPQSAAHASAVAVIMFLGVFLVQYFLPKLQQFSIEAPPSEPLLVPPQHIERFAFGYQELLADILWLRSIQDFEYCGEHKAHDEYSQDFKRTLTICEKGWIYHMLDAVTRLAPRMQIAYTRGAVALSVIVNDREGAAELFTRGGKALPESWYVHYCAGYHFSIEMKDYAKAAYHLNEAAKHGAPHWVILLSARLASQAGLAEFGMKALESFYKDTPFTEWPARAQTRYQELEAQLRATQ